MEIAVTALWVLFAIGFYRVRCWNRLVYGLIELAAGVAVIILGEFPPYTVLTAGDGSWPLGSRAAHMLTLMGGVYIVVRALDNIGQGLPGRWRLGWRRVFGA
jgi:hypothetical protein